MTRSNKLSSLLTVTSSSATIISTSESSRTMSAAVCRATLAYMNINRRSRAGSKGNRSDWWVSSCTVPESAVCSGSPVLYPYCLALGLSSQYSQGALQAGQNKLILDKEIPKLDQPMSDRRGIRSCGMVRR